MANNKHAQEIRAKQTTLRREYGGMMSIDQLTRELGYNSKRPAYAWIKEVGLEGTKIGKMKKFDTDKVAKILVDSYGMC